MNRIYHTTWSVSKKRQRRAFKLHSLGISVILDSKGRLTANGVKSGRLYRHCVARVLAGAAVEAEDTHDQKGSISDHELCHKQFGHLGLSDLQRLANNQLVDGLVLNSDKTAPCFCEPCTLGKTHKTSFPKDGAARASEPLVPVHTDVCEKMESLGGAQYSVTFIDDFSRHVWVYSEEEKRRIRPVSGMESHGRECNWILSKDAPFGQWR